MDDRGPLEWFLGMSISQKPGLVSVDQKAYTRSLLEKYRMMECKPVPTPLAEKEVLSSEQCPAAESDEEFPDYRGVVGGLLFLATHTRPDISFAVSSLSKFLSNPGSAHWIAAKRVLRYLRGSMDITLSYRRSQNSQLFGFCDADWSSDVDDRRSTSGYCFFMNELSGAVSWACRKQQTVSLSTAEAEYMAVSAASQEVLFLEKLSREITGRCGKIVILEDNQACIAMAKNPLFHRRTKHVDIRHHFIRELVQKGVIELTYCPTEDMAADLLTKGLGRLKTVKFRAILLGYIDNSKNI